MRRIGTSWGGLVLVLGLLSTAHAAPPTYHRDVAPILRRHCQECHRPGQVAPFSLLDYEHARKRAADLADVTGRKAMPPWHASTEVGGPFKDPRVLPADAIATLAAWADAGAPKGDPADAPPARAFDSEWALGEPDLILKPSEPFALDAEGRDEFRVFVLPTGLTEGRWVTAVDFKPGNSRVVHHILSGYDTRGLARQLDESDPGPGYNPGMGYGRLPSGLPFFPSGGLSGWAPGKAPRSLPAGVGRYLPAGAEVLLQVHYHKSGKVEQDQTAIGLYFAEGPVDKQVYGGIVLPPIDLETRRPRLSIPAGADDYEVTGRESHVLEDAHAVAVVPHMHWLGKDFTITAEFPDGTSRTLIRVDRWDFNWQDTYEFVEPVALPKGTTIRMVAHFDNSAANPANPSKPPKDVHWGEQTNDEMCLGFLHMTADAEHLGGKPPAAGFRSLLDGTGQLIRERFRLQLRQRQRDGAPRD